MTSSLIRRAAGAFCFLLAALFYLSVVLWRLSVLDSPAVEALSGQYTRKAVVARKSGFIYDRNGTLLSHGNTGYTAIVFPNALSDPNAFLSLLPDDADLPATAQKLLFGEPFTVTLSEKPTDALPDGVSLFPLYTPENGKIMRHLLGLRDKSGLYARFSDLLAASSGTLSYRYEADAADTPFTGGTYAVLDDGYSDTSGLVLTLDADIQRTVEEVCDAGMSAGCAVLCDLERRDILALVSRPCYDVENLAASLSSTRGEFLNRAFCAYAPGSVFKMVVAAAALEHQPELADFAFCCEGYVDVADRRFHCHNVSGHGENTLAGAFAQSCNPYFIALADTLGADVILDTARKLGYGSFRALDGMTLSPGALPDISEVSSPASLANLAFGQGRLTATPLDVLNTVCCVSTGVYGDFSLLRGYYDGEKLIPFEKKPPQTVFSDTTVRSMRDMLRLCVTEGTGKDALCGNVFTFGKTATAQSGQYKDGKEILHRIFAGVFTENGKEYALVVLLDGNEESPLSPAEIFAAIVREFPGCPSDGFLPDDF